MYHRQLFSPAHLTAVPFSLFGLALSVFMGFRNNVCYDRWWEARKQWGDLIVQARSLARESAVLLAASTANPVQERLVRRCIGFGYGLAARLRGQDMVEAVRPWVQQDELDTLAALADHARRHDWMAPDLSEQADIDIEAGRHPVVEHAIERFTPNGCRLDPARRMLWR
ncbi:hypothetical protein G6F57_019927 [Rhizopus arrhizus]|nr:hypothetical protein G6F57_019927 [Rhizopus arrhizus]